MRRSAAFDSWNSFFFAPRSPIPISLFRVAYGCCVIGTLVLLHPDWLTWYGVHAWISLPTMHQLEPGPRLNLFSILPQSDGWILLLFWVFLGSAILLTLGFLTRVNSVLVFLCLASIQQRDLYILHGGDTFLRVAGFFLMFAPAGAAFSLDRWLRIRRGKETAEIQPRSPWGQRMIQFELSLLYFAAFCSKLQGNAWLDGTALSYIYHVEELRRFPVPSWFLAPTILKFGSWLTLAVEFALGVLIWIRKLRYYILALGVLLHLSLEYSLNIPMFQWDVLAGYILFIDGEDFIRMWRRLITWLHRQQSSIRLIRAIRG